MTDGYLPWILASRFGDAPAIADDRTALSFTQLDARAEALAVQLSDIGIEGGDVVAVMLPNQVELVITIAAAWRLGATITPINPDFTADEANYQLADSGARIVIASSAVGSGLDAEVLAVEAIATTASRRLPPAPVQADDIAMLIYTSGSTGKPKGVMLDHANCDAASAIMADHLRLSEADHCLLILPLFHVNALFASVLAPLRVGGRTTIVGKFSVSMFFDTVERVRPTFFSAVPTIYALLVSQPEHLTPDMSSLRFVACGAAPVSEELLEASRRRFGFSIVEGYGLTEVTCAAAISPLDGERKHGTVGRALRRLSIRVVDPEGRVLPAGESGEIQIAGPTVMRGYLNRPEVTAETIVEGWLRTGDVGVLDEDGYLRIVDRLKDMIIRGGENIYPKEIESAIAVLDGVLEVAVVGHPDPVLGEVPVAYVCTYPDATLTPDAVVEHCRRSLTRTKLPARVVVIDNLPKNPVGKIDKPALRQYGSALSVQ